MGFDKAKVLSAAEKFLSQGKIPSAIQEYCKIVEHDASDFSALNTLGDLYVRTNKPQDAIVHFNRVAEHYREQGFALKAIAMYKKISRFNPAEPGVAQNLARLYEQQGLYVEARAQYLAIANAASSAGQPREALDALRRIADLDPRNVDIRLRLAEGYTREKLSQEASEAYVEAGELLLNAGKAQDALNAYKQAHTLRPSSHAVLRGLVAAGAAVGASGEAALVLEKAVAEAPDDLELRALLARAYVDAEDAPAAERATDALASADKTNYPLWFDVARLYVKQGDASDAARALARIAEQALAGKQEGTLLELLDGALSVAPDHVEALKLLVRVHTWRRDDEPMRLALERLADAARKGNDGEEERRALEHLVRLVPFDQGYHERLSELGGATGEISDDAYAEMSTPAARAAVHPDAPTFDHLAEVHAEPNYEVQTGGGGGAGDFEWNSVAEPSPSSQADPSASFADLNSGSGDAPASEAPAGAFDFTLERNGFDQPESAGASSSGPAAPAAGGDSRERVEALLKQELESVDFYLEQGYTDIARDTLDMLERQYGVTPETEARRERLHPVEATGAVNDGGAIEINAEDSFGAAEALTDADAFADIGAYDLTAEVEGGGAAVPVDFVDESAFVAESMEMPTVEAMPSLDATLSPPPPPPAVAVAKQARVADANITAMFGEFMDDASAEAPASHDDDFETHYNLGVAYKEMWLWDEAIEQFQKAAELTSPSDGTPHYLECCNMLGHCLTQKGVPRAAVLWFRKALALPALSVDESQALHFDLAGAYELAGDIDRALDTYSEVYGVDVSYRGVADKLRELQSQKAETTNK